MNIDGFEIERKFLIAMPDEAFLKTCSASAITQTYLVCLTGTPPSACGSGHIPITVNIPTQSSIN